MNKKKCNIIILTVILIGMIAFIPSLLSNIINVNNDSKIDDTLIDNDIKTKTPTLSKYISTYNGSGGVFNITLHQSLINYTKIEITNTSDTDNITFYEKCPTDTNFNSSFINITIEDIYAPNKSIIYEDDITSSYNDLYNQKCAASFTIKGSGYLDNISANLFNDNDGSSSSITVQLYNSSWYDSGSYSIPSKKLGNDLASGIAIDNYNDWYDISNLNRLLNESQTENNTFFIVLIDYGDDTEWWFDYDSDPGSADDSDDIDCLEETGVDIWGMIEYTGRRIDFSLKCDFYPINNTLNPEDIGLKINTTYVNGYTDLNGSGYWNSTEEYSSSSGNLKFNISAEWWDVSCNIIKVQINYTKSDILANSFFNTSGNNDDIFWNVTIDDPIDDFRTDFGNYSINFTISSTWSSVQVFNGSKSISSTVWNRGDGWQIVQVLDATNGTFWGLNASSPNLIYSIEMHIGGVPKTTIYSNETINFNANFTEEIESGNINLTVYSPLSISNFMNHSYLNDTFSAGPAKIVNLSDWDVSDNVTAYGIFRVRVFWNNGTAAGFHKTNLMILSTTDLELIDPSQDDTFFTNQIFNITLYFNDTNTKSPIDNANISYNIDGQGWLWTNENNGTSGFYNITVDCSDFAHDDYGPKTVQINVNKTYYENQTLDYNFEVICLTNLNLIEPSQDQTFYTNEIFNITSYFNDTNTNSPIDNANISYNIDGQGWHWTNINNGTSGYYNITVDCSNFAHDDYGSKTVQIKVNKTYYQNQTLDYNFEVICESDLTLASPNQYDTYYTNQNFNIDTYFEDTNQNSPIDGATMYYSVDGGTWQSFTGNNGTSGYYRLNIDCGNFGPDDYGLKTVDFTANKTYYENSTLTYYFNVICLTDLILIEPNQNDTFYSNEIFNITIYFDDINQNSPIDGATIWYYIIGPGWQSTSVNNGTAGYYNITVKVEDSAYGYNNITINANKTYYKNQTKNYWFQKVINTSITIFPDIDSVILGFNATFQINYTDINSNTIENAIIQVINIDSGFIWSYSKDGNGNYTIKLNTTNVDVGIYFCTFNISAIGNETQIFNLTVQIGQIQTEIIINEGEFNSTLVRWQGFDQSIYFYFNDTDNILPIMGLTTIYVIVYNGSNPTQKWQGGTGDNWTLFEIGGGYYLLNVSIIGLNSGNYSMILNISYIPNYNWSLATINFYIRGNYSAIGLLEVANPGGSITPFNGNYTTFIGSDINIEFNFTDSENGGILIEDLLGDLTDDAAYFLVYQKGIEYGTISHSLYYDRNTNTHKGSLDISWLALGEYNITIHISRKNYENSTLMITIIIGSKYDVNATSIDPPNIVSADGTYKIRIKIEFTPGGSIWYLLPNVNVYNIPIFNGIGQPQIQNITNLQGFVEFTITAQVGIQNLTFRFTILTTYYTVEKSLQFSIILSKYDVNATLIDPPNVVTEGESFKIRAIIKFLDENSVWQLFSGAFVMCIPIIDGIEQAGSQNCTNSLGIVEFTITVPLEAQNVTLKFIIQTSYNTNEKSIEFASIIVNQRAEIPIEIVLIILILASVVAVGAISYKGIIVPRKRRKREAIMEVATAFDDAINLEQLLVIQKSSGTCIFFKSFGAETIDPDLISGFLSAVQSFGKEIKYQQSLNEITYGDKMLLLSDGEYIRVALVLGKKGSMILRRNLTKYIKMFEGRFGHVLPEWRGDLHEFRDSDDLVDQAYNTSIILPHEVNADASILKLIKSSLARKLLKLAHNLTTEKQRKYFFLASLINEATDKAGEEAAELLVAIKELRENKAIIPIHIEKIAPKAVSQQELNIIGQRVVQLGEFSPEQKQKLIQELAQMSSAEREAFFSSLIQGEAIVSVPVRIEEGTVEVSDEKSAKIEMKNLENKAKELIKEGDLLKAVQIYENTAILAETWNYSRESKIFKERAREVSIKHLEIEMKELVKDAQMAVKSSNYSEASEKYLQATHKASEIFKLGVSGIEKQVREYENKAREYEKYV